MNKTLKKFLKFLYYFVTFGIGIVLAIIVPNMATQSEFNKSITNSISSGDYSDVIGLLSNGYYDKTEVYHNENSNIVIFRTANVVEKIEDEQIVEYELKFAYSGLYYDVPIEYKTTNPEIDGENLTKLIATDNNGNKIDIELLNYDSPDDDDELPDRINTLSNGEGYIYFEIFNEDIDEIANLTFIDFEGKIFEEINDLGLNYTHHFYQNLEDFKNLYNSGEYNDDIESELKRLETIFLQSNNDYSRSNYDKIIDAANKYSVTFILIYFIWIYILGDFLVGKHYIFRFIRFVYRKLKMKFKKSETAKNDVYGSDYYSQLTLKLIVPEQFNEDVKIICKHNDENVEFDFTNLNNYVLKQRTHAGEYKITKCECSKNYAIELPKTFKVDGYKKYIELSLKNVESKENKVSVDVDVQK